MSTSRAFRLVGAALPRTGTMSLSHALPRLLGGECYHMTTLFEHPEHAHTWLAAFRGEPVDWEQFLAPYSAGVDTPLCVCWRELSEVYDDAPVLLTRRTDATTWLRSMEKTVLVQMRRRTDAAGGPSDDPDPDWLTEADPADRAAVMELFVELGPRLLGDVHDDQALMAAYDRYAEDVRATIPADRLVEWQPGDGWEPLCEALGVPVPDEEFPHDNSTADFIARVEEPEAEGRQAEPGS